MGLYRKKPVVVEARKANAESLDSIIEWCGGHWVGASPDPRDPSQKATYKLREDEWFYPALMIDTPKGPMCAVDGDWVIKGVAGEFYSCKPYIFEATYEPVDSPPIMNATPPEPLGKAWSMKSAMKSVETKEQA